ncbi:serine hydrolase [Alkalihalobacillus sp. AL-G]|uniref:serine hydrolase n=1 Tax=Alkalihalobacillus sp. AL-G TaxID=2926399 RepID=UPI00272A2DA7|nr:serine hydrolase [Alkalihalobacillus sp. AL-G]WLD93382.1 class A beta-lactamase-related serine hydrolase [Alkalihalobacillus sp. AL-G]
MNKIIEKMKEIRPGQAGVIVFDTETKQVINSYKPELIVPLASAAKIGVGYCVAKWVEAGSVKWTELLEDIQFNPEEDSHLLYPHFQGRESLLLQDAVEVMIACHDSVVADRIVDHCGGWKRIDQEVRARFTNLHISQDPQDEERNVAELNDLLKLISVIYEGFEENPQLWTPILNGMVRQQGDSQGIPAHHLTHMTGGLPSVIIDVGVIGSFHENPLLYVIGAKDLPSRFEYTEADEKVMEVLGLIYEQTAK